MSRGARRLESRPGMSRKPVAMLHADEWRLSDGEVHYLWWYIQGSIMEPDLRWRLRRAWGMCARHAWGALLAEASYRHGYLHGPAILYEDLTARALQAFAVRGPRKARRAARRLRATAPCPMCEMDLQARDGGAARVDRLRAGRDPRALRHVAARARPYWRPMVCGRCADRSSPVRCRIHFREDVFHGSGADVEAQRTLLERIARHLVVCVRSFVWGHHGTATDEDRAALIGAVGWCSGWRGLLTLEPGP